jgi:nitrite reductase (NO-forming)
MYHCGTAPAALHIANGMYGALVVDPAAPLPKASEFVFVQSEFYLAPNPSGDRDQESDDEDSEDEDDDIRSLGWDKLLSLAPDHVVFNGKADQYASRPIEVQPNELVRLYVVNAGPNRISSFHVVGGIFERVYEGGSEAGVGVRVQTVNIPVGGGSVFQVRLREPGDYPFVTHAFADATKGAVGVLRAVGRGERPAAESPPMAH